MNNLLFITGTDTGVGKTVVSTILLTGLRQRGISVGVVKPVETGCRVTEDGELLPDDGIKLLHAAGNLQQLDEVVPYRFIAPVAPQVAAAKEDRSIDYRNIVSHIESVASEYSFVIVEGAGGLLVPLDETKTFADLIKSLEMTVLTVVGSRLGCINHCALTLEAIRHRGLETLGYVFNEGRRGIEEDESFATNRVSVSRAAAAYGLKEVAKLSFIEDIDQPSVLAEVVGLPEVQPLIDTVIKEFGLE